MYNTDSSTKPSDMYFIKNIPRGQTNFQEGQNRKAKKKEIAKVHVDVLVVSFLEDQG